jgi:hypothetical protein
MWNFFAQSTLAAMNTLVFSGSHLLKRVYLPRTIFSVVAARFGHRDHSFRHRDQLFRDRDHGGAAG